MPALSTRKFKAVNLQMFGNLEKTLTLDELFVKKPKVWKNDTHSIKMACFFHDSLLCTKNHVYRKKNSV
jgi:hypothetical protein